MSSRVERVALPRALRGKPQLGVLWVCTGCALRVHCCARRLADFFIAKLLGKHSSLDELPSLDEELFSSLNFVKRCPPPASQAKSLRPALHPTHAPLQAWEHAHTPACGVRAAATMATSRRTCA